MRRPLRTRTFWLLVSENARSVEQPSGQPSPTHTFSQKNPTKPLFAPSWWQGPHSLPPGMSTRGPSPALSSCHAAATLSRRGPTDVGP